MDARLSRALGLLALASVSMWTATVLAARVPALVDVDFALATLGVLVWLADSYYHLLRLVRYVRGLFEELESPLLER